MTIDEAIKILDSNQAPPLMHPDSRYNDALHLGIEALKYIEVCRHQQVPNLLTYLPGETKD